MVITMPSRRLVTKQAKWLTLADVHSQLPEFIKASGGRISDVRSALNLVSKVSGKPLSELLADPEPIRRLFAEAPWQLHDVSKARWANVKSLIIGVLYRIGVLSMGSRQIGCYSPSWQALLAKTEDPTIRHGLSRLLRWCSRHGFEPQHVTPEILEQFATELESKSAIQHPRERMHRARRAWNRAVHEVPGWPKLEIPSPEKTRCYAFPWSFFPETLQQNVNWYLQSRSRSGLLDLDHRIIKPWTVEQHLQFVRRFASLLVQDGVDRSELVDLKALLKPPLVKRGLTLLLDDAGQKTTPKAAATANAICSIARYLDLPKEDISELSKMASRLRYRPSGMTDKNRRRLAPLQEQSAMRKFSHLPAKIAHEVSKLNKPTHRDAIRMRFAVAVEILQLAPMRIKNLVKLDFQVHIGAANETTGEILISIPRPQVKNKIDLEYILPAPTVELLELYRSKFRPLLVDGPSSALFPSRDGVPMRERSLARSIINGIRRELGLTINPHLFRHIGALVYLNKHPGDYETVRRVLGHKSVVTTINFYAGLETQHSLRRFDEAVLQVRHADHKELDHAGAIVL